MENPSEPLLTEPASLSERQDSGWDIRNAVKNYASLVAAHGATALFSFASVWLITKHLGSEGYGGIIAFVAASQLVQIFLNWSATALARFGIEEFVETGKITRSFWSRTLILIPNLVLALLTSVFWLRPIAELLNIPSGAVWLIGIHLSVTCIWLHIQYSMHAIKMLRLQGILLAIERSLTFIGILALILADRITWENALWCYILPPAILSLAGMFEIRPFVSFRAIVDRAQLRKMLVFSVPLIPFALVGYLSTSQLDAFFITKYLSTRDLGIYAVAAQINGMTMQLLIVANTILLSMFVSLETVGDRLMVQRFLKEVLPSATVFWLAMCVVLGTIGGFLIPLVFGPSYELLRMPLFILLMGNAIGAPIYFGYAAFSNAISATYISTIAMVTAAAVNITLNFYLIPRYGLVGCALATFISVTVCCVVMVSLCHRKITVARINLLIALSPIVLGMVMLAIVDSVMISAVVTIAATIVAALILREPIQNAYRLASKGIAFRTMN
ncbi:hypothetical protein BH20ACI2_BH20ACI2_15960 [soil metagenome]